MPSTRTTGHRFALMISAVQFGWRRIGSRHSYYDHNYGREYKWAVHQDMHTLSFLSPFLAIVCFLDLKRCRSGSTTNFARYFILGAMGARELRVARRRSAARVCVSSAEAYRLSKAHLSPCANNQKQQDKNMKTGFKHLQCPWPALEPQSVAETEFGSHLGQSPCFQFPFSFSPMIPDDPPTYNTHAHTQEITPHVIIPP